MKLKLNIYFWFVFLSAVLWGIAGIFVRTIEQTSLTQMQLVSSRAFSSTLILSLIILFKDKALFKIKLKDLWVFISAGLFSIILFNYSYYTTMSVATLSVAAVLMYTAPFFVFFISIFLFKERMTANKILACIIAFIGCCMVSGLFDSANRISGKALFWGLVTGFGYALYTIFGELALRRGYKTLTITFYVFLSAAVCSMCFANPLKTAIALAESKAWITVLLMALFNTVIPYILYTTGLSGVEPSVAPIIATIEPVVATLVGVVIFSEDISFWGVAGVIVVLTSVTILNLKPLTVKANAKINLSLAITGKREDGYHLIDTVMQSVSLYDILTFKKAKNIRVVCSNSELSGEENIAFKAAKLFFERTGIKGGVKIKIEKNIPQAAGLGGGSADAAAVLIALNRMYNAELSDGELEKIAVKLGADVPFFIKGGTQRAEGIGEVLTPIKPLDFGCFVLAKGESKPSTAEMYRRLDGEEHPLPQTQAVISAVQSGDAELLAQSMDNSFAAVWKNSAVKERLLNLSADAVSLSGSGPVWFAFYRDEDKANIDFNTLKKEKMESYLVKPAKSGIEFE